MSELLNEHKSWVLNVERTKFLVLKINYIFFFSSAENRKGKGREKRTTAGKKNVERKDCKKMEMF